MDEQNHNSPNGTASNKRRRVRKACLPCRQRKRKCDAEEPCSMCSQYGYDCIYPEDNSPLAPFVARKTKSPKLEHSSVQGSGVAGSSTAQTHVQAHEPVDHGVLDTSRARYVGASSAFAFPRSLGLDFQSSKPPPLHSFAYTFGIRPEEKAESHADLRGLILELEVSQYAGIFFSLFLPIFDIVEPQDFHERTRRYYQNPADDFFFGAVIAQLAALGSFLAIDKCHGRELDLVQYAKHVLEDPHHSRKPSVDHVLAWNLRTLYLRGTTRPNTAWLASCQAVHLCEAIGLHDESSVRRLVVENNSTSSRYNVEHLRRVFWNAVGTNAIISCEYGRACVVLPHITTEDLSARPGSFMHLQHRLGKSIPSNISSHSPHINPDDQRASLFIAISAIYAVPIEHPFIALTRGDLCFCFYRRLRQHRIQIPTNYVQKIIDIGEESLKAAVQFAKERRPYWPVLGSVFQFACVLLALDTQDSLGHVSNAFRALEEVVNNINTHMSREALATARLLLRDSMGKKRRELGMLELADGREILPSANVAQPAVTSQQMTGPNLEPDFNIDWDQIFNESYNWAFGGSPQFDEKGGWMGGQNFSVGV